jgi:hypothetical protein
MNWVSNIINLFSDVYRVFDMEFAKIHGEPLRRLIISPQLNSGLSSVLHCLSLVLFLSPRCISITTFYLVLR